MAFFESVKFSKWRFAWPRKIGLSGLCKISSDTNGSRIPGFYFYSGFELFAQSSCLGFVDTSALTCDQVLKPWQTKFRSSALEIRDGFKNATFKKRNVSTA